MTSNLKKICIAAPVIVIFLTCIWCGNTLNWRIPNSKQALMSPWQSFKASYLGAKPEVSVIDTVMPPVNFSDDREFVGAADNVFVGKVIEPSGNIGRRGNPETQFDVNVILNIKGNLPEETSVNQLGGYKNGVLYVLNEGEKSAEYLLVPGSTYLFATRAEKHTLTFWPYAAELLSSDSSLTKEQLLKLVLGSKRIANLLSAYPNEVIMKPDIDHSRTPNSFQSLSVAEQEKIQAEVLEMKTIE